jgi:hypothetical protein
MGAMTKIGTMSGIRRFWLYWWVIPRVQWDLLDLDYQLYTFALFHRDRRTKLIHSFTIPAIMFCSLLLLERWALPAGGPAWLNAALVYAAVVALVHLPWCLLHRLAGLWLFTAATLSLLYWAVHWLPEPSVAAALIAIYVLGLVETSSHGFEPVPPYNNGEGRWMSPQEFRRKGGVWAVIATVSTPTIFTFASLFSNPRTFPMVLLGIMNRFGYRRDLRTKADRWVDAEWSTGRPRMHEVPGDGRRRTSSE